MLKSPQSIEILREVLKSLLNKISDNFAQYEIIIF